MRTCWSIYRAKHQPWYYFDYVTLRRPFMISDVVEACFLGHKIIGSTSSTGETMMALAIHGHDDHISNLASETCDTNCHIHLNSSLASTIPFQWPVFHEPSTTRPPSTIISSSIRFSVSAPQHSTRFHVTTRPELVSTSQTRTRRWKPP